MKVFRLVSALVVALMLVTGCDFFRSIMGKPTSKDLERMRQEALEQERRQRIQDSVDRARQLELEKAMKEEQQADLLDESAGRYHVILGSFKVEGNAEKMFALLGKNGYTPHRIRFNNGFDVVSVAVYDDYRDALRAMNDIMEYEFCPEDVWIYDIRQNLHVKRQ
ncbi:MAG TPA: SPOR domain-containing protein [Candidatus Coprenecus merdigallinarum]|mgnify:CR=1 FL=1|nr:SPOR domain-containing protein [Candidatus Coprenecus merdigallinarum]